MEKKRGEMKSRAPQGRRMLWSRCEMAGVKQKPDDGDKMQQALWSSPLWDRRSYVTYFKHQEYNEMQDPG